MSLGYDREPNVTYLGDTAEVRAYPFDKEDSPIPASELASVSFTIQLPDKTSFTDTGVIDDNGTGVLNYSGTTQIGAYTALATFTRDDGNIVSFRCDFEVIDPLKDSTPSASYVAAASAWFKLEDCFDAEDEGPWLRDMTLNFFNKDKMEMFIAEALFDINFQNPPTQLDIGTFVFTDTTTNVVSATTDLPLLASGIFLAVLRHLMRSYTEQGNPVGANIAWIDRRDYQQRWAAIYQIEQQQYIRMLALYKRQFLGLGHTKGLLGAKAGRMVPAPMRTRFVGRGYW